MNRWLAVSGAVLALLLLATACGGGRQTAVPADGEIVTVFIGDLAAEATASGSVAASRQATISAETPGTVTAVSVRIGDTVAAGDVLVQLDAEALALNVANAEQTVRLREAALENLLAEPEAADIASAEAAVASAQANLDNLLAGAREAEIAISEASVRASQASVAAANADLAQTQATIRQSQIVAAQASLEAAIVNRDRIQEENEENPNATNHQQLLEAQQAVADAQANLDALLEGPDTAAAQSSIAAANARLEGSQIDLSQTLAAATEADIAAAEQQLAQAQASLAALTEPPTATEIAAAEAELTQAELTLADAQDQLAAATITAPFAGVVTAVNVTPGELATGVVAQMVDPNSLELVLEVDEVDIGMVSIGQPATITLETWPDVAIESEVARIAPGANSEPGSALVTYDVHLALAETELPVRVGMTANANLVTAQREGVLLAPNAALDIDRQTGVYTVNLRVGDDVQETEVTIGLRDSRYTQILDGLNEGDELVISSSVPLQSFGPPAEE